MTKFGFYLQKVTLIALIIGSMVAVIPFILLIVEMIINGSDSFASALGEFLLMTTYEENEGFDPEG